MRKIKVLQLTSSANLGGTERNVLLLSEYIDKTQFEIAVACIQEDGPLLDYVEKLNVPIFRLKMSNPLDFRVLAHLKSVLEEYKPDIIHIYGLRGNIVGRMAARGLQYLKVVCGIRSIDSWRKFYHVWLDKTTAGMVDLFISNSEAGKKAFVEREKFSPGKIIVIHNGIDLKQYDFHQDILSVRKRYHWEDHFPMIGHIAHIRPLKGHRMVLSILPTLVKRFPNIKIVCLGRDYMNGELAANAQKVGLADHIEYLGYQTNVKEYLPAFDICILPSEWEGLPNSIIESMAMAKPVIATNIGGIPELIEHGKTGYLVPSHNPEAFLESISQLLSKPELIHQMGLAGRKKVEENFTLEKMVLQIQEAYINLLK